MKSLITDRQKELLQLVYEHTRDNGYSPSLEEMRGYLGVSSNQAVLDLLKKLENENLVHRDSSARSLKITFAGFKTLGVSPLIANLGVTKAGAPLEMVEISGEWETTATSDVSFLKDEIFILKVSGDSMVNAGIDDGDAVLVKSQKEFISGDIVLAGIGDGSTIKRFISEDRPPYVYLKPENPKYGNIVFTDEVQLKGKVISILKEGSWKSIK